MTLSTARRPAYAPQVAFDAQGTVVAVWQEGTTSQVQVSRRPAGGSWSAPVAMSDPGRSAFNPQVAVDARGTAVAVWRRYDGTVLRVQAARQPVGGSWSAPVTLSDPGQSAGAPQVALDGRGNATAVWQEWNGTISRVQAAHQPAGGSWSTPVTLSGRGQDADEPQVAVDWQGTATAVWQSLGRVQAARRPAGGTWSTPVTLSNPGENVVVVTPQVAVDGQGAAVAVWESIDGATSRVQAARQPAGGTWSTPVTLSDSGQGAGAQQVAVDGQGTAVAVWQRKDGATYRVQAARRPAGGTWSTPVTLSDPGQDAHVPQVAVDGQGTAVAVWQRHDGTAQRVQAARQPAGGPWSTPVTLSDPGQDAYDPQVALDGQGNATAVWFRLDSFGADQVQAAGLDAAGPTSTTTGPSAIRQTATRFGVGWSAADRWSPIASHDVRYRVAAYNGQFGPWHLWKSETTAASASFTGAAGRTYGFAARARDTFDNLGGWSEARYTTTPVDDRALAAAGGWTRQAGSGYYLGTDTTSTETGGTLTRTGENAKQLSLLVATVPGGGTVTVSLAGELLGTFHLASAEVVKKELITVKTFATVRAGTVRVRIVSPTGRPVHIDGLVASRM